MLEQVRAAWDAAGRPYRVLAAVSGGADSVAMLLLLYDLQKEGCLQLQVAHVNHHLREAAAGDAAFVQALCERLGLPCTVEDVHILKPSGIENAARGQRYRALGARVQALGADALALAHHAADQAETLLMHAMRGSGAAGMSGMAPHARMELPGGVDCLLWRPLLAVMPELLRGILKEEGIPWREDESNQDTRYTRNAIRHQLLPVMQSLYPQAVSALSRTANILRDEADCLNGQAMEWLREYANGRPPCRFALYLPFQGLHVALKRRIVRALCEDMGQGLDAATTDALIVLRPGERINLPQGWHALCTAQRLHIVPPSSENVPLIPFVQTPFSGDLGDGKRVQAVPISALEGTQLRTRRAGDRIQPFGMLGGKLLSDYLIDRKVDEPFRDYVPLLCRGHQVLWVVGTGVSEQLRAMPSGGELIQLQYTGWLPGDIQKEIL